MLFLFVAARFGELQFFAVHFFRLKLPSFATVKHNASVIVSRQRLSTSNGVIDYLYDIVLLGFYSLLLCVRVRVW